MATGRDLESFTTRTKQYFTREKSAKTCPTVMESPKSTDKKLKALGLKESIAKKLGAIDQNNDCKSFAYM